MSVNQIVGRQHLRLVAAGLREWNLSICRGTAGSGFDALAGRDCWRRRRRDRRCRRGRRPGSCAGRYRNAGWSLLSLRRDLEYRTWRAADLTTPHRRGNTQWRSTNSGPTRSTSARWREAVKLYQEFGFPRSTRAVTQESRRLLPGRHRHHQSARPSLEIQRRRSPAQPLGRGLRRSAFMDGFAVKFRPLVMSQEVKLLNAAPWGPHP